MPRSIVITCDRCGQTLSTHPVTTKWIPPTFRVSTDDYRYFVPRERKTGVKYHDLCARCGGEVDWCILTKIEKEPRVRACSGLQVTATSSTICPVDII